MKHCVPVLLCVLLASSFCARNKKSTSVQDEKSSPSYESVLIEDVPHIKQKTDFCGEACAAMYLKKLGKEIGQDDVFNVSGLDPEKGRGCYAAELSNALEKIGFNVGDVWVRLEEEDQIEEEFKALYEDLVDGIPSIVCMHYCDSEKTTEHFRLVLGYDSKKDEVIYHEPSESSGSYRRMARKKFLKLWPLEGSTGSTVIRLRLEQGEIKQPEPVEGFSNADYAQHIIDLKERVPDGFTIVLQRPFVVIGDESALMVKKRAALTVKWTVDHLKQDYFTKDPNDIIDIWLFKDNVSYLKHAKLLFGDQPDTPYGYYTETHKALVMNIATGGGTLVHEIVHPFMASNFPQCPPWFNEGLGSLYEQCQEKLGHMWGLTNWRLPGLQSAIKEGGLPSFKDLTSMDENEFYNDTNGTNYGQSRYLCLYLQEKGLLVEFYHKFHKNRFTDPTGYKTLKKILGEEDMDDFKDRWEKWVLKLKFK